MVFHALNQALSKMKAGKMQLAVADLEIQKGGFSYWRTKRTEILWFAMPTSSTLIHT